MSGTIDYDLPIQLLLDYASLGQVELVRGFNFGSITSRILQPYPSTCAISMKWGRGRLLAY